MKETHIIANWKENLTIDEAQEWFEEFRVAVNNFSSLRSERFASGESNTIQQFIDSKNRRSADNLAIVICPSFVLIPVLKPQVSSLKPQVYLGAQDVSKFEKGQYTGEVSAKMLKDFVDYIIVGHSERRRHFGESDEDVVAKSILALKYGLTPIVCVSTVDEARSWKVEARKEAGSLRLEKTVFVYEPVEAISTEGQFHPDDPEHAQATAKKIKSIVGQGVKVLYGGSVKSENVKSFVSQPDIDGVLVGQASLDSEEFVRIVNNLTI